MKTLFATLFVSLITSLNCQHSRSSSRTQRSAGLQRHRGSSQSLHAAHHLRQHLGVGGRRPRRAHRLGDDAVQARRSREARPQGRGRRCRSRTRSACCRSRSSTMSCASALRGPSTATRRSGTTRRWPTRRSASSSIAAASRSRAWCRATSSGCWRDRWRRVRGVRREERSEDGRGGPRGDGGAEKSDSRACGLRASGLAGSHEPNRRDERDHDQHAHRAEQGEGAKQDRLAFPSSP